MCCSVVLCVAVRWSTAADVLFVLQCFVVCCPVLQCFVVCCSDLEQSGGCLVCVAAFRSVLQCFAVCCSVLQ